MATQPGDKVKLEAVASTNSIPRATRLEEFAVLVRVTAAPGPVRARAGGVDLVAVLDVSGSMDEDNRLERMKRAMVTVIDQLGSDDRLCVVTFSDEVQRRTELCVMSDDNRGKARAEVSKLTAAPGTSADAKAASEEAARILAQRAEKEQSNRAGRIIFLSNGDDDDDDDDDDEEDEAVHGLGQSSATPEVSPEPSDDDDEAEAEAHPVLEQELTAAEAFGLGADDCLSALSYGAEQTAGVYTYASQDVDKIHDATARGVTCTDAAMGVQIDLQARESVAITALGSGGRKVSVGPRSRGSVTIYIHDLYAGEHKSFLVYLTVPEGVEEEERLLTVSGLFRDSESSDEATPLDDFDVSVLRPEEATPTDETICPEVASEFEERKEQAMEKENQVQDMPADIPEQVVETPLPAKQQPENVSKPEEKGTVETIWRGQYYAFCAAVLLLLGAAAMLLISNKADDGDGRSLDVSRHPGWPKMEESLGLAMVKKMEEDASITSFLQSASIEDMSRTMTTYIYLALVHDSRVPILQQTIEVLEEQNKELCAKIGTLAEEMAKEEMETVAAYKENGEAAVERANMRIVELERQLQDKKAFTDSLSSEVANIEAHLKTCGQSVDKLEAKVLEIGVH